MSTVDARLLAASNLAYEIVAGTRQLPPSREGYDQHAGLASGASCFTGGPLGQHAAFASMGPDGLVVAFRGTQPPFIAPDATAESVTTTVADWIGSFDAAPVHVGYADGLVHEGFALALEDLWGELGPGIRAMLATAPAATPVWLTGHSKGGAMAFLAAARLLKEGVPPSRLFVRSFEAPRPGTREFGDFVRRAGFSAQRHEYGDDIVPHLPPSRGLRDYIGWLQIFSEVSDLGHLWDYVSAGRVQYLSAPGQPVRDDDDDLDAAALRIERLQRILFTVATGNAAKLVTDHFIARGSGLWTALN